MSEEQTKADLLAAAELLERDGWCQGHFKNKVGQRCLRGALIAATANDGYINTKRLVEATEAIEAAHDGRFYGATWNDRPGRTADEVIALLREAAA